MKRFLIIAVLVSLSLSACSQMNADKNLSIEKQWAEANNNDIQMALAHYSSLEKLENIQDTLYIREGMIVSIGRDISSEQGDANKNAQLMAKYRIHNDYLKKKKVCNHDYSISISNIINSYVVGEKYYIAVNIIIAKESDYELRD